LASQDSSRALDRRLRHYTSRTGLLVIDEVGYLSYDSRNADLLFQGVSRRYEQRSLVLTSNLAFSDRLRAARGRLSLSSGRTIPGAALTRPCIPRGA